MKVLIVSSEVVPFAKTGGLADVAGALPKALKAKGVDVRVVMPKHDCPNCKCEGEYLTHFGVEFDGRTETAVVLETSIDGKIPVYIIDNKNFFSRPGLYGESGKDYDDNALRFGFFSKAVLELCLNMDFIPDVLHINDWQSAMVAVYKKVFYEDKISSKVLLTIHNLQYQGVFDPLFLPRLGLGWDLFDMEKLEFYGKINFLKGAIVFSDAINTVSPTYAKEIQTPEFGYGLDGILKHLNYKLYGILNGIDYDVWNPKTDPLIWENYDVQTLEKKQINKKELAKYTNLPENRMFFGLVSRLVDQKGLDILIPAVKEMIKYTDACFVFLGSGQPEYEEEVAKLSKEFSDRVWAKIGYDNELAHKIYVGVDAFLVPSKFEPCGLTQMISMRYGTPPVVRNTGGLADTVVDPNEDRPEAPCGIKFDDYTAHACFAAMKRAYEIYTSSPSTWRDWMTAGMRKDFSFSSSAEEYIKLYKKISS